jgi:DNA repair protein RadC
MQNETVFIRYGPPEVEASGDPGELLETLLGRGGRAVLTHGSLVELSRLSESEIRRLGIPRRHARRLIAAFALARAASRLVVSERQPLRCGSEVFERFRERFRGARKETFFAVLLDGKNRILREAEISVGTLTSSLVHPREVFAPAVRESAAAIIVVHNHPSGDPNPSPEDREVTRRLRAAGEVVGIRVLDHVVVGDGSYASFLEKGWL